MRNGDSEIARPEQSGSDENRSSRHDGCGDGCSLARDRRVFCVSGSRSQNDQGRQRAVRRIVGWHPRLGHEYGGAENGDTFSEIDASTGKVVKTIKVGRGALGVSSDGTHVWVTNTDGGTVSEIDASTGTVVNTIQSARTGRGVSSDGTHVWVTNFTLDDTVSEIDASTGTVVNTIPVSGHGLKGCRRMAPTSGSRTERRYGQ